MYRPRLHLATALLALGIAWGACWTVVTAQEAPPGALRGSVYDKDFEVPLSGVRVAILGIPMTAGTSPEGAFVFERVPPGTYTLVFAKDGYEREVLSNVAVTAGRLTEVRVDLSSEVIDMEEMVVSGSDLLEDSEIGLLEVRSAAAVVQDAISSELISKAGASDVSGALRLVVGASVAEGKYATVRGLSDRYTATTLNGIRIPSADPRRRSVQVDLFPTGTIESLTVSKSFTPDLQGDFTGGGVDIRTKSSPDDLVLSGSTSIEFNSNSTGNSSFLTYAGGGVNGWGFHAADRGQPSGADRSLPPFPVFSTAPNPNQVKAAEEYDELTRSFAPVMGVSSSAPGPNSSYSLVAGNRFEPIPGWVVGLMGAVTYSHKYDFYEGGTNNNAAVSDPSQPITLVKTRSDSRGVDEVLVGGLLNGLLRPNPNHEFSVKVILNESAEDEARLLVQETGASSVEQNQSLHYTERTVTSTQIHGDHSFPGALGLGTTAQPGLRLDWLAAVNSTRQQEPDVRFFRNVFDFETLSGSMPSNSTDAQNTRRISRDIGEDNRQAGANFAIPFTQWSQTPGKVKLGAFAEWTDRDYEQQSFTYKFASQFGSFRNPDVSENLSRSRFETDDRDQLWTDVFLNPRHIGLAVNTPPAPNQLLWTISPLGSDVDYTGDQTISAYYAMAELPLSPKVKVIAGARQEATDLAITPENQALGTVEVIEVQPSGDRAIVTVPQQEAETSIEEDSLLPSLSIVYEVIPHMNIRASWARTIARPTFRELAPVATEEFIFGDEFIGNPDLQLSNITNYDLRWEWFPGPGQVLSMSGFYKRIEDPIELISFSAGGRSFIQPINFEVGTVRGGELEATSNLGFLSPWLRTFSVGVNYTIIDSEVEVPEAERTSLAAFGLDERTRRLQGQPDYLFNANIVYENPRTGTSAAVFYNLIGETLLTGAARGVEDGNPNVFEEAVGTLDLTVSQKIGKHVSLSLKARNLLNPDKTAVYRTPDGEEAVKAERETPALLALSASWSW